jgi:transcriptional regulator with XRE-family HTH domain
MTEPEAKRTIKPIGERILALRRARGWSQERLAEQAGLDKRTVSGAESGKGIYLATLKAIATALGVPIREIVLEGGSESGTSDVSAEGRSGAPSILRRVIADDDQQRVAAELAAHYRAQLASIEQQGDDAEHIVTFYAPEVDDVMARLYDPPVARRRTLSTKTAVGLCQTMASILIQKQNPRAVFPLNFFGDILPAWSATSPRDSRPSNPVLREILPTVIFGDYQLWNDGNVIEGTANVLSANEYWRNHSLWHKHCPHNRYSFFREPEVIGLLGWSDYKNTDCYLEVISCGTYRISGVRPFINGFIVTLTRETPTYSAHGAEHQESFSVAPRPTAALKLLYRGFDWDAIGFYLYNEQSGVALVQRIRVLVHSVTSIPPEAPPGEEGIVPTFRYEVTLSPTVKVVTVTTDSFRYGQGDIDYFTIEFSSAKAGFEYQLALLVDWRDLSTGSMWTLESPKITLSFPKYRKDLENDPELD